MFSKVSQFFSLEENWRKGDIQSKVSLVYLGVYIFYYFFRRLFVVVTQSCHEETTLSCFLPSRKLYDRQSLPDWFQKLYGENH